MKSSPKERNLYNKMQISMNAKDSEEENEIWYIGKGLSIQNVRGIRSIVRNLKIST